ncbi:nuclease [Calothrix sp. UHCC 0171]|uniref:nuclease n=1 Tax=Calothrix sp. UHCC 0171 TaxID=3110245 RepID=UPI002B205314|nr:nuclease [Calothrix sp. UHCC 0171]MEA5574455.1 nuclease [Calothrix sp. UHCC 0171]
MNSKSTEPEASPIIFDNTVLSNFALAEVFDVLQRLYPCRAFVGKAVQREIQAGINSASTSASSKNRTKLEQINQALDDGWLRSPSDEVNPNDDAVELRLNLEYSQRFGAGESEAMAIARNRGWVFASDDGAARKFAKEQSISITGTLGILVKAVKNKILCLSLADAIHRQMVDEGYRSPLSYENGISTYLNR